VPRVGGKDFYTGLGAVVGMNSKDWHKGFEDPRGLGAAEVAWLEQAVASFPYSAALHALYAKALKNQNHYLAPQALRRAAVVSPNRRALMAWMEGADFSYAPNVGLDAPNVGQDLMDADPADPTLSSSNGAEDRLVHEVPVREAAVPDVSVALENSLPKAPEVPVSQPVSAPAGDADLSHLPEKVRDAILRSRAISNRLHPQAGSLPLAVPVPSETSPAAPENPELGTTQKEVQQDQEPVVDGHVQPDRIPHGEPAAGLVDAPEPDRLSKPSPLVHSPFSQWLAQQTGSAEVSSGEGPAEAKSAAPLEGEAQAGEPRLQPVAVVPKPVANDLINKFLEREGPLRPTQAQRRNGDFPESQRDLSASSLGGDPVFMTETLAQLYLQQGAFDKAVQAYEILRLKYPEKSAIFAAQILEIRLTQRNKKP